MEEFTIRVEMPEEVCKRKRFIWDPIKKACFIKGVRKDDCTLILLR